MNLNYKDVKEVINVTENCDLQYARFLERKK